MKNVLKNYLHSKLNNFRLYLDTGGTPALNYGNIHFTHTCILKPYNLIVFQLLISTVNMHWQKRCQAWQLKQKIYLFDPLILVSFN